ncbi:hypothetical protein V1524DRAFT_32538 [Lipomyces starkeyi]
MTRSPIRTPLPEIASVGVRRGPDGSISLHTLGIRLLLNIEILRLGSASMLTAVRLPSSESRVHETTLRSLRYELEAMIGVEPGCTLVDFHIRHRSDLSSAHSSTSFPSSRKSWSIVLNRINCQISTGQRRWARTRSSH